jgi:hypothetical protein
MTAATSIRWVAGTTMLGLAALASNYLLQPQFPATAVAEDKPVEKSPPQQLFTEWPKDRKPDLVLVVTGQMNGYLQKCGCSNPQRGGLERRYNFIQGLKERGWEVMGIDLGDVPRPLPYTPTPEQTLTKYEVAMQAMKLMGYQVTGVGQEELALPLLNALTKYSIQKGNELPAVSLSNIDNRNDFPDATGTGSALSESNLLKAKSGLAVGVVSLAGFELTKKEIDRSVKFSPRSDKVLQKIFMDWETKKSNPDLNVLLYQGPVADAETAAKAFPQFQIVVCQTQSDSEPPNQPKIINDGKSMICMVGHKGQNVAVIGIYRGAKGAKGFELFYQRVSMTDQFDTDPAQEANNPILKLLQEYSETVKNNDYLSEIKNRKRLHPMQVDNKNATYVGNVECMACHKEEGEVWKKTKHSHAYEALEKLAKKPTGRQFDGECIICHTVGYDYKSGYVNEKTTAHLKNVQCESCHGPGNLHTQEELENVKNKMESRKFLSTMTPWKVGGKGHLPTVERIEAMLKEKDTVRRHEMMDPVENRTYLAVYQVCAKCHDIDNDPKFDLLTYWKDIVHTGLSKKPKKK